MAWGGDLPSSVETNVPPGLSNVVAICSGAFHSLALKSDGRVEMWGDNSNGSGNALVPSDLNEVVSIACGYFHNVALKADGSLVTWGFNVQGALSVPAGLSNVAAIAAGTYHTLALGPDRAPSASPLMAGGPANQDIVIALFGTDPDGDSLQYRITTLPTQGTLYECNSGSRGAAITSANTWSTGGSRVIFAPLPNAFGNPYASFSYVANDGELDSSPAAVTLSISGTAYASTLPASFIGWTSAVMNGMALANGLPTSAWFDWGTDSSFGQTTTPVSVNGGAGEVFLNHDLAGLLPRSEYHCRLVVSNAAGIAVGFDQQFTTGGRVTSWGRNIYSLTNTPSGLTNVVAVAGGGTHSLALRTDGTVRAWGGGDPYYGGSEATNVPVGLSNVIAIAAGDYFSLALRSNGTIAPWGGYQYAGGPAVETNTPVNLTNVIAISAGGFHALALRNNGTVVAWGGNSAGQTNVPGGLANVVAVAAGGSHSLALRIDGTVVAWGSNDTGQRNVPFGLANVVAIAAGANHSLALRADGRLVGWGNPSLTNIAAALTSVVRIAAGGSHNLALRADGTMVCWGANTYGQTNVPAGLTHVTDMDGGGYHSLAVGINLAPQATSRSVAGPANSDLVIRLTGYDANGDEPAFRITTLPDDGALYQCTNGVRGTQVATPLTPVNDLQGRIIFTPSANGSGNPYAAFTFVANDGELDSSNATVTITIQPPLQPVITTLARAADGLVQLGFTGHSNTTYCVWDSTNLVNWDYLGAPVQVAPGFFEFLDSFSDSLPQRFYRISTDCVSPRGGGRVTDAPHRRFQAP